MRWREMPGQRQWVLAARGTDIAADSAVSAVSAAKAMPVNSAARFWFMQVMAWARGLDNGLFKVAKHSYLGRGMCMAHTLMLARFTCCEF